MSLEDLGYNDWFRAKLKDRQTPESQLARVIAIDRDRCMIGSEYGSISAELSGRLIYCAESAEDMPCVGDWVLVDCYDNNTHAIVHDVLPRRTVLRRRSSGVRVDVQSCDVDYNLNRLDRYMVMTKDGGIDSILLLTKSDLVDGTTLESMIADVRREHPVEVIPLSSTTGAGYDRLRDTLGKGKTYCLIGSSGAKGRHTTTRRQLVVLGNGSLFVDTPGMRELGMLGFDLGIDASYKDIGAIAERCRFSDCTHTTEKDCAVLRRTRILGRCPRTI